MSTESERDLMRLVAGELPAERAAALERRLATEPELAALYRRLQRAWTALELPPVAVPPGYAGRVAARASALRDAPPALAAAPLWVRAAAALALVAGVTLGAAVGLAGGSAELTADPVLTLAEGYWQALDEVGPEGTGVEGEASP